MKIRQLALLFLLGWTVPVPAQTPPVSDNDKLLYQACSDGKLDEVKRLVEQQGAAIDAVSGPGGFTPLIVAAHNGHLDVLLYLIDRHVNLDKGDVGGSTSLLHATWQHHDDCALALMNAGANVSACGPSNYTPLMYAARHGDDSLIKAMLAKKVELDTSCNLGTAIIWAANADRLSTVILLGDAGANLKVLPKDDPMKFSVLAMAAVANDTKMIDYLLQHGMDVNFPDGDGETPLMAASWAGRVESAQHLLDAKANIDLQNQAGETALMIASDIKVIHLLLAAHPNLELKNKKGQTVLLVDAPDADPEWVHLLVEAGADINATDPNGETALTIAGDRGSQTVVDFLKSKGARRTDLHVIPKELPAEAPTPAQAWALAVGMIYTQYNGLNPQTLGGDRRADGDWKAILKRDWAVTDKASLLHELDDLRDKGHHTEYQETGQRLAAMNDDQFNQLLVAHADEAAQLKAMKASYLKWKDRTGMAWDLCRSAMLVNLGYAVGYMEYQEAWDRLQSIAVQTQVTFTSWQEMSDNFLDGREIWAGARDPQFEACAQLLLNPKDPNSPWNQNPWNTVLSKPGHGTNTHSASQ